jgi:pimeloyl-ACP methyl ester carboxylesterase
VYIPTNTTPVGEVIVTEERWNALPKKIMAAGALLFDEPHRILLVDQPTGYGGSSPVGSSTPENRRRRRVNG